MINYNARMELDRILDLNELAKKQGGEISKARGLLTALKTHRDKTLLGLCGPRGAGKTILLKQVLASSKGALYLSVDTLAPDADLFSLVKEIAESYKIKLFLLDEVHFNQDIDRHLKAIYDFLDVRVFFTSSVSLKMFSSAHDLARRAKLLSVPYFSFREYLDFTKAGEFQPLSFQKVIGNKAPSDYLLTERYFHSFLEGGLLPFALEVKDWRGALTNTLQRIINDDLPRVSPLTIQETMLIGKAVRFIGSSAVDGINATSLGKNIGVSRYKAEQYLNLLQRAFVTQLVAPKGTNVLKEPKVLLAPPYRLLYQDIKSAIGGLREDFAVDALTSAGLAVHYLKSSRGKKTPDYLVELNKSKCVIEVGGASKGLGQFAGIATADKRVVLKDGPPYDSNHLPLAMLGFLR